MPFLEVLVPPIARLSAQRPGRHRLAGAGHRPSNRQVRYIGCRKNISAFTVVRDGTGVSRQRQPDPGNVPRSG